jgi:hypothetical protein
MAGWTTVVIDEAQVAKLAEPGTPLTVALLSAAAPIVARGARRRVPVLSGDLYDSVGWTLGADQMGPYGRVYADWYDRFLEKPAKQIPRARRSLRTALRDIPKLL